MITEENLFNFGYRIKTRSTTPPLSVLFIHFEFDSKRTYWVSLEEGEVTIHYPNNLPQKKFFRTNNLEEFKQWHERYMN